MKRLLVTGGAGFIGSHTVDLFLEKNWEVIVFDNLSTGKLSSLNCFHPHLRVVQADVLNYPMLAKEMARCDAVLHLAALASVPQSIAEPVESLKINLLGFVYVLQAIRAANKSIRLVYASSAAVYGNNDMPCRDDVALPEKVLSPYALEKANNERYAALYSQLFNIPSLGLRYFNVYGSRQDPQSPYSGVISKFISRYQKQEPIIILGDGKQSRDFIEVADVARANLLAIESDYCGALNIATGTPKTLLDLVAAIENAGDHAATLQFASERAGDIRESYATVEKAKECLKFECQISLIDGIKKLMN